MMLADADEPLWVIRMMMMMMMTTTTTTTTTMMMLLGGACFPPLLLCDADLAWMFTDVVMLLMLIRMVWMMFLICTKVCMMNIMINLVNMISVINMNCGCCGMWPRQRRFSRQRMLFDLHPSLLNGAAFAQTALGLQGVAAPLELAFDSRGPKLNSNFGSRLNKKPNWIWMCSVSTGLCCQPFFKGAVKCSCKQNQADSRYEEDAPKAE